jgi:hypothetical protein
MTNAFAVSAVLAVTALFAPAAGKVAPASPAGAPSAEEVKKVATYYYGGKDAGPILVRAVACTKIEDKNPATMNECVAPVTGPVAKDTVVFGWTEWLVPVGAKYDVSIQFLLDGAVRETKDAELTEGLRFLAWRSVAASKAGKWTIKVQRAGKDVQSLDFDVK